LSFKLRASLKTPLTLLFGRRVRFEVIKARVFRVALKYDEGPESKNSLSK